MKRQHDFSKTVICSNCDCRPEDADRTLCKPAPMAHRRLASEQQADAFYNLNGDIYYCKERR